MMKPPMVKSDPMIVKTRTKIAPALTLDLFSLFINRDPTIMMMPQTTPMLPQIARTVATLVTPATVLKEEPAMDEVAATIIPAMT